MGSGASGGAAWCVAAGVGRRSVVRGGGGCGAHGLWSVGRAAWCVAAGAGRRSIVRGGDGCGTLGLWSVGRRNLSAVLGVDPPKSQPWTLESQAFGGP
eukprot:350433-Chlamydomonas_euryale.AAC.2